MLCRVMGSYNLAADGCRISFDVAMVIAEDTLSGQHYLTGMDNPLCSPTLRRARPERTQ